MTEIHEGSVVCQEHWDMLKKEIDEQGLSNFVSANGTIAAMKLTSEANGDKESLDNFDPLMRCYFMLLTRAMEIYGLAGINGCLICKCNSQRNPDGSCICPDENCHNKEPGSLPDFETWLVGPDSCVTSVKGYMKEMGWLTND
jgi:hypothetical protein